MCFHSVYWGIAVARNDKSPPTPSTPTHPIPNKRRKASAVSPRMSHPAHYGIDKGNAFLKLPRLNRNNNQKRTCLLTRKIEINRTAVMSKRNTHDCDPVQSIPRSTVYVHMDTIIYYRYSYSHARSVVFFSRSRQTLHSYPPSST